MDTGRTRELFASLIQRPTLTDQLLQRPPFKFLHDIVRETLHATAYPTGIFTEDELDSTKAGSSRDNKISFLQKLIDVLNIDGHLDNVKPAKIVAGKEPEMTNILLQSLASEAASYNQQSKKTTRKSTTSSKTKSSSKSSSKVDDDDGNRIIKTTKSSKQKTSKIKEKDKFLKEPIVEKKNGIKGRKNSLSREISSKDKERNRRSNSISRSKITADAEPSTALKISQIQPEQFLSAELVNINLPDSRTPPDRESSGGTSKGGDDSGIADETGAESERHDLPEKYGLTNSTIIDTSKTSTPDFIEIHSTTSPTVAIQPLARPGTATGRPQTAIGRPGTAIARPAPPKPKKNIIATNLDLGDGGSHNNDMVQFILEDGNMEKDEKNENFLVEEDEEKFLLGSAEGANISKLQESDDHGLLVNKIIGNTRELGKEHLQEDDTFVESDSFGIHEQRRIRNEIESTQKSLQKATQYVQPLVRTLEFVADDFDTMLRELEGCRKQTAIFEHVLDEHSTKNASPSVKLDATMRALDNELRNIREQLARTTTAMLRNERKIAELLAIKQIEMK